MTTFLGVPIRVRGEVFGNLYLTEKAGRRASSPTSTRSWPSASPPPPASPSRTPGCTSRVGRAAGGRGPRAHRPGPARHASSSASSPPAWPSRGRGPVPSRPELADRLAARGRRPRRHRAPHPHHHLRAAAPAPARPAASAGRCSTWSARPASRAASSVASASTARSTPPSRDAMADHLVAVVREAVTNVVKHAEARRVEVDVVWATSASSSSVADDGIGLDRRDDPAHAGAPATGWPTWPPGPNAGRHVRRSERCRARAAPRCAGPCPSRGSPLSRGPRGTGHAAGAGAIRCWLRVDAAQAPPADEVEGDGHEPQALGVAPRAQRQRRAAGHLGRVPHHRRCRPARARTSRRGPGAPRVGLEAHHGTVHGRVELGALAGADDDPVAVEHEVHRHDHRQGVDREAQAPDRHGGQPAEALVPVQHLEAMAVQLHAHHAAEVGPRQLGPNVPSRRSTGGPAPSRLRSARAAPQGRPDPALDGLVAEQQAGRAAPGSGRGAGGGRRRRSRSRR